MRKVAGKETLGCYRLIDTVNEELYTYCKLIKYKLTNDVS